MAAARSPLPPLARALTPLQWAVILGLWFALEMLAANPLQQQLAARGIVLELDHVRIGQVIDWAVWAVLLWPIFATLDRLPLRRRRWPVALVGWAGAGLLFGAVHAAIVQPLLHLVAPWLGLPARELAIPELGWRQMARDDAGNFVFLAAGYLVTQLIHRGRQERARARETERSLREARLHGLALELQPHFLFNTLNGIAALVRADPRTAERMLVRLSDLLRLTLDTGATGFLRLDEELRRLELYLSLQRMRHGDRLTVHTDVPQELGEARVPAMLLQPLVENALSHGIGGRPGPGTLQLRGWRDGSRLCLTLEDDGVGVPPGGPARTGIGLGNTRARLAALYPGDHEFLVEPRMGGGTRVMIRVPYHTDGTTEARP
jgi:hypothetical protein